MLYNQNNLNVVKIAAKQQTRPEIAGVLFTPHETVATDSFRLVEITAPNNVKPEDYPKVEGQTAMRGVKPFIVDSEAKAIKIKKNKDMPILNHVALKHVDKDKVQFYTTDLENATLQTAKVIEGTFPDYKQIFPKPSDQKARVKVNIKYLKEMLAVLEGVNERGYITICSEGQPLMIEVTSPTENQVGTGLLMPLME